MDDIAREAGMSRPAVYQYVRNKEDAFRRLTERMLNSALAEAREASRAASVAPTERMVRVLEAKLGLALTLWRDSPAHAAELLGADSRLSAELIDAYTVEMRTLLIEATSGILPEGEAPEFADLLLAFTRGLEADTANPGLATERLRRGVTLFVAGLGSAPEPARAHTSHSTLQETQ